MNLPGPADAKAGYFAAAVLAGGRGKRLGMDKTSLEIDGKSVLGRIVNVLKYIFPRILVVVQGDNQPCRPLPAMG
jgi:molybdopterin-guanine dinucleotide biosynthesis protein A